ncbi:MAG: EVE domain-containing protein [Planctomycetes bacterium]|nr:EVE domain-containing protein [Planctomycetota bacterium]
MTDRNYWSDVFSLKSWAEFLNAGGEVSGHPEKRWNAVQTIKPGDYLLAYLTKVSRFVGILEVVSEPYRENSQIWEDALYPCRLKVRIVTSLTPETAIPIEMLRDRLSIFKNLTHPSAWTYPFLISPYKLNAKDGEAIVNAILKAQKNPVLRPLPKGKPPLGPKRVQTKIGPVTVPGPEEVTEYSKESSIHDEIQWQLLKIGNDMGLDVWVARNDRNKEVQGHRFTDLTHLKEKLPVQFDEATNRTIELIDVLWLKGNAITAAFEIESTTSIYSGLLRMSDLIAMHPNVSIPLYIVVPEERRNKVFTEVNRPTFSRLSPPLSQICKLITFSTLQERIKQIEPYIDCIKPLEFLDKLSESCEVKKS